MTGSGARRLTGALSDALLIEKIREIHAVSDGTYGARRVHVELRLEHDVQMGPKRVERLMAAAGYRPGANAHATRGCPGSGSLLICWSVTFAPAAVTSDHELVIDAIEMALHRRRPDHGLIHHSPQGCQPGLNRSSKQLLFDHSRQSL